MKNAIEINNICKNYGSFKLQDVSFTVPCGSIVGFVGENGAGKTTTIKSILDVIKIDSGSIKISGEDHIKSGPKVRQEVGVVFDECNFHDWLRADQVGKILRKIYTNWDDALYAELLQRFSLPGTQDKKSIIKNYSRGMKMKLTLAAALAHHPKILVLDEATSGLDPVIRDEILDIFMEFIQNEEHSILFSSHITSDIEKAADYLVFIHNGQIVLDAEKDELLYRYAVVRTTPEKAALLPKEIVVGRRNTEFGVNLLVNNRQAVTPAEDVRLEKATVDDIMLYTIKGG